jgi:DNA-binding XRE family transcriptional regulator
VHLLIKETLNEVGVTEEDLARKAGVDTVTVMGFENNSQLITSDDRSKIVAAYIELLKERLGE